MTVLALFFNKRTDVSQKLKRIALEFFIPFFPQHSDHQLISYVRQAEGSARFLVILNLSHRPCYFRPTTGAYKGSIEICTANELQGRTVSGIISLEADQGMIIRLEEAAGR